MSSRKRYIVKGDFASKRTSSKFAVRKVIQFKPSTEALRMRRNMSAHEKELKSYLPPM